MYSKFRNVPIFKDFPPICPYFLGFRVDKYVVPVKEKALDIYLVLDHLQSSPSPPSLT